ncbi:hypothetical protein QFZ81_003960 [Paenibacillus sp. V4I9]|uniref:hypothetical protein n=1 Tax=Paenibacillus sp. V4I9 TaxID=3042308 RepID=UPI00277EED1D|nr:hypothetical protein [Paenibacillus sp. V4I9]MDQ0888872.1 hypothetical protein [Paenibacillus sp. V4I9]
MKRLCSLLFLLIFNTTGCGTETDLEASSGIENQKKEVVEQNNQMPKVVPNDFDFMVRFGYGEVTKNEINTYQDTVTKDLIMKGTAKANITFTTEEIRSIYEKMREINVFGMKELVPTNMNCSSIPYNEESWKISVAGEIKTITWSDKNCDVTSDAKKLLELRTFIQQIVAGKDAYKQLPKAEGGYE